MVLTHPAVIIKVEVVGICKATTECQEIKEGSLVGMSGCIESFCSGQVVIGLHFLVLVVLLMLYQYPL